MAKLNAHKRYEVGELQYPTKTIRIMSDNTILENNGSGWRVGDRIKPEYTPIQAFDIMRKNHKKRIAENPEYASFLSYFLKNVPLVSRIRVIDELRDGYANDAESDKVYQNFTDHSKYDYKIKKLDAATIDKLYHLYRNYMEEVKSKRK